MKKILKFLLAIGLLYLVSLGLLLIKSGKDDLYIKKEGSKPLIIAHGGTKKLAPENSMLAFDKADSIGADMLEMDVQITKDSVLITFHDDILDKKTDTTGYIKNYTLDGLQEVNFGFNYKDTMGNYPYREKKVSITTLESVLEKYGSRYPMSIEIKVYDEIPGQITCRQLCRLIEKYDMSDKVIVSCFENQILNYFRIISDNKIRTSASLKETKTFVLLNTFHLSHLFMGDVDVLQIPVEKSGYKLDDETLIRSAHRKNIAVHYWTINDPQDMKRLIEIGADGIITDRPDIMRKVLNEIEFTKSDIK